MTQKTWKVRNYPFMAWSRISLPVSLALMVLSLILFFIWGLNYGIDFRGGTELNIVVTKETSITKVREMFDSNVDGDVSVTTESGAPEGKQFMKVRISPEGDAAMNEAEITDLKTKVSETFPEAETRGVASIGGAVSGELIVKGLQAVGLTLVAIGIYIWLRFEWSFALGAIFALVHDTLLTLGVFVVTRISFDLSVVAAVLALIGYSLNDTVVVYDRIRERMNLSKTTPLPEVINTAINETLSRTMRTSLTTLIAVAVLLIFGGPELRGFSIAMIWGIIFGTYSSIFIASPILLLIGVDREEKPRATTKFSDLDI